MSVGAALQGRGIACFVLKALFCCCGICNAGSAHFVRNTRQPNGTTILRNRLLAAYGWRVVSIQAISKPLNLHRVVAEILGSLVSSAQQS